MSEIGDMYNAVYTDCVVATDGAAGGNGTAAAPLTWTAIKTLYDTLWPGVTIQLRAGIYAMDDTVQFSGNQNGYSKITGYPGEVVKINGSIWASRDYLILQDIEIYDADFLTRSTLQSGSNPSDIPVRDGFRADSGARYLKLINCVIHDCRQGLLSPVDIVSAELYGCVIYYNGWSGPDRGHGHGAYLQNVSQSLHIKDCIIHSQFGYGVHAYGETGSHLDNITVEGNTCFDNGVLYGVLNNNILVGGYGVVVNSPVLRTNMTYGAQGCNLGYDALGGALHAVLENNYFPDGITKVNAQIDTETDNYYGPAVGNQVFVRPNDYQTDRANVTVYNEANADTVSVDLSAVTGLSAGDDVTVANVQDLFVDIQTLTLDAEKKIAVNMQAVNRSVATPQGWDAPATTFPTFGCFVVEKA